MALGADVNAVAEHVDARLARTIWDTQSLEHTPSDVAAAAEVAVFALRLAGKKRQARRGGRFGRLIVRFTLAACLALSSAAAACDKPSAAPEATAIAIGDLPTASGFSASIGSQPRAGPAQFTDLVLLDAGSETQPWALMSSRDGNIPILVDRTGSGLLNVGDVYRVAAQPVPVGTRDGLSQFLDPLQPAVSTSSNLQAASPVKDQMIERWSQDERFVAVTRAIAGRPTVLDAAYNAAAAATAGGTHNYLDGVVLRTEPDQPVLEVIDRALLESGRPTRAEDVVYVAIRAGERSLYEPGQVVNLRDVVMDQHKTDVEGQPTTVYVANAALDGARVEPIGRVDLQAVLQPRLDRVEQDLAVQGQEADRATAASALQPTATPRGTTPLQPPVVYRSSGPAFVDDFLIWMWLSHSGFYRGSTVIINNPPASSGRPGGDVYYSRPPGPSGAGPSTIAASQAASRSTALEAARTSISGQSSGTGGGVGATNKAAAEVSSRVSAATAKSASVAGESSAASIGKSIASAPSASSSTASRSSGAVAAGVRGGSGGSGSGGGKGISGSSGGSSGFGGKGVSGGGSSS